MTETITNDVLDDFKRVTLYDINGFLSKYIDFTEIHYSNISNYFAGITDVMPVVSFTALSFLIREQKRLIDVVILNAPSLDNYEHWALVEYIEDIGFALETANNLSKWLRSASTKNGFKQQIVTNIMTSQGQGLEALERDVLKSNNPDGWVNTALENQLREEDYDLEGGELIKIIYKNNASLFINGVVDNIDTSDKTYGLDIDQNIAIEDDDLVVLTYKDTMFQSAKILGSLYKGDDPAFFDRGVDVKSVVGTNLTLAGIAYPIIFRQLAGNFATDDTFKSFSITDIVKDGEAARINYQVETRVGEVFDDFVQI